MLSGATMASLDSAVVAAAVAVDGEDGANVADSVLDGYGGVPEPAGVVATASTTPPPDVDGLDAAAVDGCAPVVLLSAVCGWCVSNAGSFTQDGVVGASGLYDGDDTAGTAGRRPLVDGFYAFSHVRERFFFSFRVGHSFSRATRTEPVKNVL